MAMARMKSLGWVALVGLGIGLVGAAWTPAWSQLRTTGAKRAVGPVCQPRHLKDLEVRIWRLTNEERRKKGLAPLTQDNDLAKAARKHSDDMLQRKFFSHVNPDGKSPQDRIAPVVSQVAARTGENIWSGSGQDCSDAKVMARMIVDSWMTSPGHRANILNPNYTHLGVGVSVDGKEIRATQAFARYGKR
jgi:uncharacterized protein YkwD